MIALIMVAKFRQAPVFDYTSKRQIQNLVVRLCDAFHP